MSHLSIKCLDLPFGTTDSKVVVAVAASFVLGGVSVVIQVGKNGVEKASIPVVDYWILFHSVKKIMLDWPICKTICHKSGHA